MVFCIHFEDKLFLWGQIICRLLVNKSHQHTEHSDGEMCPLVFGRTPSSVLTYIILVTHWNNCTANAT